METNNLLTIVEGVNVDGKWFASNTQYCYKAEVFEHVPECCYGRTVLVKKKFYVVECSEKDYLIPSENIVESKVVIPEQYQDTSKNVKGAHQEMPPNNDFTLLVKRPDADFIRYAATIVRM